jgi:hypothetical protein
MMLWHSSTHSGQIKTLLGPSISVSAWLADLPQKLQITFGFLVLVFFTIVEFPSSKQTRALRLHFKKAGQTGCRRRHKYNNTECKQQ